MSQPAGDPVAMISAPMLGLRSPTGLTSASEEEDNRKAGGRPLHWIWEHFKRLCTCVAARERQRRGAGSGLSLSCTQQLQLLPAACHTC
jgi:hypothetical protein